MRDIPQKIIISHSLDHLPPPYCYQYQIEINLEKNVEVGIEIKYFDRDEISKEEVEAEGFSDEDDFTWKGNFPENWNKVLFEIPVHLVDLANQESIKIQLIAADKTLIKQPKEQNSFEYLIQEIIQAAYEVSGKQEELNILFKEIENGKTTDHSLIISFYKRMAIMDSKEIDWSLAQKCIAELFSNDFDEFNANQNTPKKNGLYVNIGDVLWYKADNSIKGLDKKPITQKLQKLIQKLVSF